ncbi:fused isobutyryl-CoA mutase/GTPase IcmF [Stenotrophobium rhamnosiphilum]|uniref:Fused isobutyryl-CoA mutase n=1 Tax=Stenotrophobium rhamnosiphilum TaxID=2029166 RepID=A0A2T5MKA9_9GAMM|nr:fused isobutyryl-CoA mutase/GTPase IcmF [Stenotrophobium rhamnosiphilum]PTU32994.1 methylmalonyl-CoA mutase [Stenotrophobium rhamnosiphilum]
MSNETATAQNLPAPERKPLRFITAASLFDGHDAAINIMRRIIQQLGAEVIHLGHNRSVEDVVTAALQEDAHAIALSSYQGGHVEYFKYMVDMLKERGGENIKIFGGGGGVIVPEEIKELHDYGVGRIYSPQDGQKLGLEGMIKDMVDRASHTLEGKAEDLLTKTQLGDRRSLARLITLIEAGKLSTAQMEKVNKAGAARTAPVLGITGTGGAGKSSVSDELIRRFRLDQNDQLKIAIIAVDPSRRKSGGALLGDRIRMNAINHPNIFFRSLATREGGMEISPALPGAIAACKAAGFDLIFAETAGIGQGDAAVVEHADVSLYVMTPEFGAASQLEKIDMLDFADIVAVNKFDRRGAEDAVRDVSKQVQRNKGAWSKMPHEMPVFGTIAARFNDNGVTALYHGLREQLAAKGLKLSEGLLAKPQEKHSTSARQIVPGSRARYLAEISDAARGYRKRAEHQAQLARERQHLRETIRMMEHSAHPVEDLKTEMHKRMDHLTAESKKALHDWPAVRASYSGDEFVYTVRDKEFRTPLNRLSLSGTKIPRVALPKFSDEGDLLKWLLLENLPGYFPYTAGVFPFKREGEDPTRMFAGEGGPARTNARFHLVSKGMPAHRLSTAFDSVTLYGEDPAPRPDIYGKVGNSGVSIATLDDMKQLYAGFDLCAPTTSVSMTINGPAPTILALYFNAAIDQQASEFEKKHGRQANAKEYEEIKTRTLATVRGTVQADILKEDQGQNTCIFSTEFALKCMGDIQQFFIENNVRNFYSVSISGYHIAEAGANPISQLAFTLSNGFTFVEAYLARGMKIDDFAPNLSFFFSNGMDPEYSVMGRVARRIWAVAMKEKYGANARSQMLKYHIQTSGRSLHAQEIDFNDIRTTLQALIAIYDNCNSLHTNAYDEAITTPTTESVRRALAIQLIINNEWGVAKNENPNQGAFLFDELTDLVEEAVLKEFERISERGGVLGAMETGYQRGRIQEESMHYEHKKHDGSLPIIGVNTFLNPNGDKHEATTIELARSSDDEKQDQLTRLASFHDRNKDKAPAALAKLKEACINNSNIFAELMNAARVCSLGQITHALFEVGGQYRRNM